VSPLVALVVGLVLGGVTAATILLRFPRDGDGAGPEVAVVGLPEAAFARRLLDLMDPAVVLVDVDDAVLLANPSARALGIVRGSRVLVPELLDLVKTVRNGGSRRADVRLPGDLEELGPAADGRARGPAAQRHGSRSRAGGPGAPGRHGGTADRGGAP
jgi:hypothetical protein